MRQVVGEVEFRVLDPVGVPDLQRPLNQLPTKRRNQVEALLERLANELHRRGLVAMGRLDQQDPHGVHGHPVGLYIEHACVQAGYGNHRFLSFIDEAY